MKMKSLAATAMRAVALLLGCCVIFDGCLKTVESKRLLLRPLNASEVYRVLRSVGREDIVPEGRIVTNGLAAMTGWALGLTKAMAAVFIYDVITANVTAEMLNEAEGNAAAGGAATTGRRFRFQEVCFNTRQARSLEEAEAVAAFYTYSKPAPLGGTQQQRPRKGAAIRKSDSPRRHKRRRRNKHRGHRPGLRRVPQRIRNRASIGTTAGTGTNSIGAPPQPGVDTLSGTGTLTAQPTTTAQLRAGSPTGTFVGAPTGTALSSDIGSGRGGKHNSHAGTTATSNAATTGANAENDDTADAFDLRQKQTDAGSEAGTITNDAVTTAAATPSETSSSVASNLDDTSGTGTTSSDTTETWPEGAINCLVIEKSAQ